MAVQSFIQGLLTDFQLLAPVASSDITGISWRVGTLVVGEFCYLALEVELLSGMVDVIHFDLNQFFLFVEETITGRAEAGRKEEFFVVSGIGVVDVVLVLLG